MLRGNRRQWGWIAIFACMGAPVGYGLAWAGLIPDVRVDWPVGLRGRESYTPSGTLSSGTEVVLVYVGSSTCAWSNVPRLPKLVEELKLTLQARAKSEGKTFFTVGVARDLESDRGLRHLEDFGTFDEVMSGGSWINTGILKYIFDDLPGPAATPQLVLLERLVEVREGNYSIVDERILARAVGLEEIDEWGASWARSGTAPDRGTRGR